MASHPVKYKLAKGTTILLTGVTNLLGLSGILSLNDGHYLVGSLIVASYLGLLMFDTWLYLWILEKMTHKKGES